MEAILDREESEEESALPNIAMVRHIHDEGGLVSRVLAYLQTIAQGECKVSNERPK